MHPRHPPPVFDRGARMVGYGPPGALLQPGRMKLGLFGIITWKENIHRTWISSKVKKERVYAITDMPERPPFRRVRAISRASAFRMKSDIVRPQSWAAALMASSSVWLTNAVTDMARLTPVTDGRPRPRLGSCMA